MAASDYTEYELEVLELFDSLAAMDELRGFLSDSPTEHLSGMTFDRLSKAVMAIFQRLPLADSILDASSG